MKTAKKIQKRQRQAVGSLRDAAQMTEALAGLRDAGIGGAEISLLIERAKLPGFLDDLEGKIGNDDPRNELLRERDASAEAGRYVAIGPLAKLLDRAGEDALPDLAPLHEVGLASRHAQYLQAQVEAGKALIWVFVHDGEEEGRVCRTLLRHGDGQVQVHDLPITPRRGPRRPGHA